MSKKDAPQDKDNRPAVGGPVQRMVGRPVPERLGASVWAATRQLLCPHTHGRRLLAIEFDGEAVYQCAACGKHIGRPL